MRLGPARKLIGRVTLPGDKSVSHRAAIIAGLANGTSELTNFATSLDCSSTLSCLTQLGVRISRNENTVRIHGVGGYGFRSPSTPLDCGNSGSTMRMLAGVLAGQDFTSVMTGDYSLSARPMGRIIEPLELMGAKVVSEGGKPPLTVSGTRNLQPIVYELSVASAQVKSCLLFAGLRAGGCTSIRERQSTRDHTERLLNCFGIPVATETLENGLTQTSVVGPSMPDAHDLRIPGDVSSAAFLVAAAGLLEDSELEIINVGLNQTRTQFLSVFQSLGVDIEIEVDREDCNEPVGNLRVRGKKAFPVGQSSLTNVLPANLIPQLIDELPLLAVVGTRIQGGLSIRNAGELRFKESDRIATTVSNLRSMGATVEEFADGMSVPGPQELKGARIHSHGDHRIAMAFSVASLFAQGESELVDPECVKISFPAFFEVLESIAVSV